MLKNEAIKLMNDIHSQCCDTANILGTPDSDKRCEAVEMAIKALEEIQQYRTLENELKETYHANVDIPTLIHFFIETIFKGEKHEGFCILTNEDAAQWERFKQLEKSKGSDIH